MLVPGFISGIIGFLLLLPPVRAVVRPFTRGRIRRRFRGVGSTAVFSSGVYNVDSHLSSDPVGVSGPRSPPRTSPRARGLSMVAIRTRPP